MDDMSPADVVGDYTECVLTYYDNTSRKVLVTDIEISQYTLSIVTNNICRVNRLSVGS